jgi:hypothetical protein
MEGEAERVRQEKEEARLLSELLYCINALAEFTVSEEDDSKQISANSSTLGTPMSTIFDLSLL